MVQSSQLPQSLPLQIVVVQLSFLHYSGGPVTNLKVEENVLYLLKLHRKLRGKEEIRCANCCFSPAKRPKMSVPELPPVEAPEEEVEEEVKVTAEEMANMAVSNRPHTQVY